MTGRVRVSRGPVSAARAGRQRREPCGARRRRCLSALLLLATVTAGCGREAVPAPDVVARIGSAEVRYVDFERYLAENSVEVDEEALGSPELSALFDQFLDEELLRRLAVDRGLATGTAGRRAARNRLLAGLLESEIDAEEVAAYYREHAAEFELPERVELRQILVEDREQAERARAEWVAGDAYEEIVLRFASDPDSYRTSEGRLARQELPPVFADTIFDLAEGQISDIVAADYGFHIFQVTRRLPAERTPLAEAEASIRRRLARGRSASELARLVETAAREYNVRVFARNIPFNYDGSH